MRLAYRSLAWSGIVTLFVSVSAESRAGYLVTNLVSDVVGLAAHTDSDFKNPWGVSYAPTGPFWVSDQRTNLSTLYNGTGTKQGLIVTVPPLPGSPPPPPNGPTGQVFNNTNTDLLLANGRGAAFLFANLNGQISGWNGGTTAQVVATGTASGTGTGPNSVYTGLAIGPVSGHNVLFAADTRGNKIDVYDSAFNNLNATTYAGKFIDPSLPSNFRVFNVQNLGGVIYVTYDNTSTVGGGSAATNGGVVATFGLDGHFISQLVSNGPGGPLEDPWGVVIAPSNFGEFSGDLLVGNKESGDINAFDPLTGSFLGRVATVTNDPTQANNGLWALTFGNGGAGGDKNTLYAFAGINNEVNGLMVAITSVPEPSSVVLMGIGGVLVMVVARHRGKVGRA